MERMTRVITQRRIRFTTMPYDTLTQGGNEWLSHVGRWGSAGYPVRKRGSRWAFERMFGVGGTPTTYRTKGAAEAAFPLAQVAPRHQNR